MKVWIEKPVTELPKKDGYYNLLKGGFYNKETGWSVSVGIPTHYLVPIEVDHVLTDKELEEIKVQAWKDGFFEVKTDYIKNNKQ